MTASISPCLLATASARRSWHRRCKSCRRRQHCIPICGCGSVRRRQAPGTIVTPASRFRMRPPSCASRRMPSCSAPAGCPISAPPTTRSSGRRCLAPPPGVPPCRLIAHIPSPIVGAAERGIDLVVIRESTEGLFASMGKGVVTHDEARETLVITRRTSERLFEFSFRLAERRKERGRPGRRTCAEKANVFQAFAFFREMFDEAAKRHPEVRTDRLYVDACSALLVKRPWDFDVMVMENMFGDILSDMTAGLIGGMGMAPSADIGDRHAVFQPCHGTAPDIMGQGKANPTGMILSAAMMLDWLADKHGLEAAAEAGERIERAVDKVYADGIKPMEFGGRNGTADIAKAVLAAL